MTVEVLQARTEKWPVSPQTPESVVAQLARSRQLSRLADQAELVPGHHRRPDDSPGRLALHGPAGQRHHHRGGMQPRHLPVATGRGGRPHQIGRVRSGRMAVVAAALSTAHASARHPTGAAAFLPPQLRPGSRRAGRFREIVTAARRAVSVPVTCPIEWHSRSSEAGGGPSIRFSVKPELASLGTREENSL
jgi:hypothetical protein